MSEIHKELLKVARIDLDAVKVLTENGLFAPAIYHSGQVTEKSAKSIFSYHLFLLKNQLKESVENELRKKYGHDLVKSTKGIVNVLLRLHIDYEIKTKPHLKGRKESESKKLQLNLDSIELDEMVKEDAVFRYEDLVKRFYLIYYYVTHPKEVINLDPSTDISGFSDPSNEYLKYI